MANEFNKNEVVWFDQVLERFEKDLTLSMNCDRFTPSETDMQRQGDQLWRPMPFIAQTVDGLDITGLYADLLQLSVPGTLSHIKNVPWQLDVKEMRDSWYMEQESRAAAQALAASVEGAIALNVAMSGAQVIKRGALSGYDDLSECDAAMTEIGVPRAMRKMFLNTRDNNRIASNLAARQTMAGRPEDATAENRIGRRYAGFDTFDADVLPRLTAAAGGAITVNGANQVLTPAATSTAGTGEVSNVDNRFQLLTVTGTTGVAAGDCFTIDGVNKVHLITKEDTGQPFTLRVIEVVSGTVLRVTAMINSGPYQNVTAAPAALAGITWLNTTTTTTNIFWHQKSVEIIGGRLPVEQLEGMKVMKGTTDNGIQLFMAKQGNIDNFTQKYRWGIFFGTSNKNPLMNGIMLGGQS